MIFIDTDTGLKMIVDDSLLELLYRCAKEKLPNEFGGYLVGRYSDDYKTCHVQACILPLIYKSTPTSFIASPEGLESQFREHYQGPEKLYYIGEWHSHPAMLPIASSTDRNAMKQISEDDAISISNPVMIIIGAYQDHYKIGAYVQFNNRLIQYGKN